MRSVRVSLLGHRAAEEVGETWGTQTVKQQQSGLNGLVSLEAQRAVLRVDPVSPGTWDSSVTAPTTPALSSPCLGHKACHIHLPSWEMPYFSAIVHPICISCIGLNLLQVCIMLAIQNNHIEKKQLGCMTVSFWLERQ